MYVNANLWTYHDGISTSYRQDFSFCCFVECQVKHQYKDDGRKVQVKVSGKDKEREREANAAANKLLRFYLDS